MKVLGVDHRPRLGYTGEESIVRASVGLSLCIVNSVTERDRVSWTFPWKNAKMSEDLTCIEESTPNM